MIHKPIDQIEAADLQALVDLGVQEDRTTEYKRDRIGEGGGERKEFVADLCALANAGGGDMILGVVEERGLAKEIVGLDLPGNDVNAEKLRLESIALNGISPRLPVRVRPINGFPLGAAIVIRVPRTFNGPHLATHGGTNKFYSRNSGGKFLMDVGQIRDAFLGAGAVADRIRQFCRGRVSDIIRRDGPLPFFGPFVALHIVPLGTADGKSQIDLQEAKGLGFLPIDDMGGASRFNLDGYLVACATQGAGYGYVQLFRNGSIEAARPFHRAETQLGDKAEFKGVFFAHDEIRVLRSIKTYIEKLESLRVVGPFAIQLSAVNAKGFHLDHSSRHSTDWRSRCFDRDEIMPPTVLYDRDEMPLAGSLRPLFDAIWQSAGYDSDTAYDANLKGAGLA